MGDDDRRKMLRKESVCGSPDNAGDKGGHHKHEIAGSDMDKGIQESRGGKSGICSPAE